jgi:hypothetical protein
LARFVGTAHVNWPTYDGAFILFIVMICALLEVYCILLLCFFNIHLFWIIWYCIRKWLILRKVCLYLFIVMILCCAWDILYFAIVYFIIFICIDYFYILVWLNLLEDLLNANKDEMRWVKAAKIPHWSWGRQHLQMDPFHKELHRLLLEP